MSEVRMTTHCPLCGTEVDPADFHVKPKAEGEGLQWTYECLGCNEEKTPEEWIKIHMEKHVWPSKDGPH